MKNLSEVIRNRRKELGLNQKAFGRLAGLGQTTVSDLENGKISMSRNGKKLSSILGVSERELAAMMAASGIASNKTKRLPAAVRESVDRMVDTRGVDTATPITALSGPPMGARDIPVYGRAEGGKNGEYKFNGEIMGWEMRPPVLDGVRDAYAIYVDGESMYPRYKPGETAWVNPAKPPARGDDVIVQIHPDDENAAPLGYIKEFVARTPQYLILRQFNPPEEIHIQGDTVKSVHVVVYSQR